MTKQNVQILDTVVQFMTIFTISASFFFIFQAKSQKPDNCGQHFRMLFLNENISTRQLSTIQIQSVFVLLMFCKFMIFYISEYLLFEYFAFQNFYCLEFMKFYSLKSFSSFTFPCKNLIFSKFYVIRIHLSPFHKLFTSCKFFPV